MAAFPVVFPVKSAFGEALHKREENGGEEEYEEDGEPDEGEEDASQD